MPEPHAVTLGGIVKQGGREQVRVVVTTAEQPIGNIEAMPAVGNRHRFEQCHRAFGQDPACVRRLFGVNPRSNVGDELSDPMHRSAPG